MLRTPISCALVLLALATPAAARADDPSAATADTLAVADVTATTATFKATVNPHGLPTTAHFEYGTTEDLLQSTPDVAVGDGSGDLAFTVPVTALLAQRHYYVAVYATNAAGGEYGSVVELTTPSVPRRPPLVLIRRLVAAPVTDLTAFSATLHVQVTGYGEPVLLTASTTGLDGLAIPSGPVTVPADGDVPLPLSGLKPGTRYRWQATVTRTGGTDTVHGDFTTPRLVAMPRPTVTPKVVEYGGQVTVTGRIPTAPGLAVTLQEQPFPFAAPFAPVPDAAGTTDALGTYRFTVNALRRARYGVSAVGFALPDAGNTAQVRIAATIDAHAKRARRGRFVVTGRYWPDVPATAVLFRRGHGRSGRAVAPARAGGNSRSFRFPARRLLPGRYEIRLVMAASTGIESTHSAPFTIPRR